MRKMLDIIAITCPSCGSKLKITKDIDRFSCAYCGTELIVVRREGIIALKPVLEKISRDVDTAARETGNTASELAIVRLDKEILDAGRRLSKEVGKRLTNFFLLLFGISLVSVGIFFILLDLDSVCKNFTHFLLVLGGILIFVCARRAIFHFPKRIKYIEEEIKSLKLKRWEYHERVIGDD